MEDNIFALYNWQEITVYNAPLGKRKMYACHVPGTAELDTMLVGVLREDDNSLTGYSVVADNGDYLNHVSHFIKP
jgi:hypothetical protein